MPLVVVSWLALSRCIIDNGCNMAVIVVPAGQTWVVIPTGDIDYVYRLMPSGVWTVEFDLRFQVGFH